MTEKEDRRADNALPAVVSVRRVADAKNMWVVTLDGCAPVTVSTARLRSYSQFHAACMEQLDYSFAPVGAVEWSRMVNDAMRETS
jgi:hypothetical protein